MLDPIRAVELLPISSASKQPFACDFHYNKEGINKNLKIQSAWEKNEVRVNFDLQGPQINMKIQNKLSVPQFTILQKMVDYSLPYMMGWHVLNSNKIAQEDFMNESN